MCQAPNSSSTHRQAGRLPSAGCVSPRHSVEPAEAPPILAPISPNPVTNANAAIASTWLSEFYLSRPRFPQPERVSRHLAPRAPVMRPARSLSRDKTVGPRILTNQLAPQRLEPLRPARGSAGPVTLHRTNSLPQHPPLQPVCLRSPGDRNPPEYTRCLLLEHQP